MHFINYGTVMFLYSPVIKIGPQQAYIFSEMVICGGLVRGWRHVADED